MCPVLTEASGLPAFEKTPRFCKKKKKKVICNLDPSRCQQAGEAADESRSPQLCCLPAVCPRADAPWLQSPRWRTVEGAVPRTEDSAPITGVASSEAPKTLTALRQGTRVVTSPKPLAPQLCAMGWP